MNWVERALVEQGPGVGVALINRYLIDDEVWGLASEGGTIGLLVVRD